MDLVEQQLQQQLQQQQQQQQLYQWLLVRTFFWLCMIYLLYKFVSTYDDFKDVIVALCRNHGPDPIGSPNECLVVSIANIIIDSGLLPSL